MADQVHVVGASGRAGAVLCRALAAHGVPVVAVVRNLAKWQSLQLPGEPRVADLTDHFSLGLALRDAVRVVSCAHASHTRALMAAGPEHALYVLLGSTRRFTRWPDDHGLGVIDGERVFIGAGRAGVMLHPTMIYGATEETNVQRLAALLRRLPLVPLPGGGVSLVQPIHEDDVTACILAALGRNWGEGETLVIAGPTPVRFADFVRAVARAAGLAAPRIVGVPAWSLMALAPFTWLSNSLPTIGMDEIRRLTEDQNFEIMPMFSRLGIRGRSLEQGLAQTFAAG